MDTIDVAQQRQQDDIEHALAARRVQAAGREDCDECGAAISALRQQLGAQLCLDCQSRAELQAKQWNRRS